jgi:tRNA 2-thiouridine synthesizing protein E
LIIEEGGEWNMTKPMQVSTFFPKIDEEGFLSQPETWNKAAAEVLAQGEVSGELTEDHWKVIDYLRNYYLQFETVPPVKMLCRDTGLKFNYICKLFPSGLTKGACKIAGIPKCTIRPCFLYP